MLAERKKKVTSKYTEMPKAAALAQKDVFPPTTTTTTKSTLK